MSFFEVLATDSQSRARLGRLTLMHGTVETPVFMPVGTAATVKALPHEYLESFGAQIILANTYHLYLRPGDELIASLGGLHKFMSWDRPILTDSGGFQIFSQRELISMADEGAWFSSHLDGSKHFFTPEKSIQVQKNLASDIMMVLDECTSYPATYFEAAQSLALTLRWARRCREFCRSPQAGVHAGAENSAAANEDFVSAAPDGRASSGATPQSRAARGEVPGERSGGGHRKPGARKSAHAMHLSVEEWEREQAASGDGQFSRGASGAKQQTLASRSPSQGEAWLAEPPLFGIVQGSIYTDLRAQSVEVLQDLDFPGYGIGGLGVGEPKQAMFEVAAQCGELLPIHAPRYLMGVGTPPDLLECVALGMDMFDCVLPTRNARNGYLFTSSGRLSIKNARHAADNRPVDERCQCPSCRRFSRAYLRHLFMAGEILSSVYNTVHNVFFYLNLMAQVRRSIATRSFSEFRRDFLSRYQGGEADHA